jgi:hypothetical protein
MTDLKAANEALAKALAALDSPEHDADVREAEAIRNRLIELDGWIGARIEAKLEAHRAIAEAWAIQGQTQGPSLTERMAVQLPDDLKTATSVLDRLYANLAKDEAAMNAKAAAVYGEPESQFTADAWQAHHEEHAGKYAMAGDEIPERVLANGVADNRPQWQKDLQEARYKNTDVANLHPAFNQATAAVCEAVAEMQQAVNADEQ